MTATMIKTGDNILISPDLTGLTNWVEGIVIEVENNTFNGIVIAAETKDRNVFFGRQDLFKFPYLPTHQTKGLSKQTFLHLLCSCRFLPQEKY